MAGRRSTRFYRRNEEEVMSKLGFKPTINSGAGWIEKEDGQNDYLIAQLKSTDAESIRIHQRDIQTLEVNAAVVHKVPCFVVQFLNNDDTFIMCRPNDLHEVARYVNTGKCGKPQEPMIDLEQDEEPKRKRKTIKSSSKSKEDFWKEKRERWSKR